MTTKEQFAVKVLRANGEELGNNTLEEGELYAVLLCNDSLSSCWVRVMIQQGNWPRSGFRKGLGNYHLDPDQHVRIDMITEKEYIGDHVLRFKTYQPRLKAEQEVEATFHWPKAEPARGLKDLLTRLRKVTELVSKMVNLKGEPKVQVSGSQAFQRLGYRTCKDHTHWNCVQLTAPLRSAKLQGRNKTDDAIVEIFVN